MFRSAAALLAMFPACPFDEDSPHRLGGRGEEMRSVLPVGLRVGAEPEPRFVDERGRLKRVSRLFPRHLGCRQASQLGVDERQQFISGFGIALLDGLEDARDVVHGNG